MKLISVKDDRYEVVREIPSDAENLEQIKQSYEELFNAITLINNKATSTTLFCRKIEDGEIDEN